MIHFTYGITKHISQLVGTWFNQSLYLLKTDNFQTTDQGSVYHLQAYKGAKENNFLRLYNVLVGCVQADLNLDSDIWCIQAIPTFRFQTPGLTGTKEYHRDLDYGHPVQSLNVIVPVTDMTERRTFEIEKVPYTEIYEPVLAKVGEVVVFNGSLHKHGSQRNTSEFSRVSFDFRFAMKRYLTGKPSVSRGTPLTLGAYYRELE